MRMVSLCRRQPIKPLKSIMERSECNHCMAPQVKQPDAARVKRFVPFSEGRRDCVGQHLARMNYTSTLARLLGNFHFELAPEVSQSCCWKCTPGRQALP